MRQRLWSTLAAAAVLVIVAAAGTTGALWSEVTTVDAGIVKTGNLELLAGGQPENYVFTALSAANLAPGNSVSAPLVLSNSGTTRLAYQLAGVTAATSTAADEFLVGALALTVTDETACTGAVDGTITTLYQGKLAAAGYNGGQLAPSSSVDLCLTVSLADDAPLSASQGTVRATFTFRGDQAQ